LKLTLIFGIIFSCISISLTSQDLQNPLILDNEWQGYAIGDPYVLKHRGIFYLYCSTKDAETGVKCWSSINLINWKYEGLCAVSSITKGAYAPEVIYWNGTFYMYTSPAGNGHYVLSSASPTGPFNVISTNLGKSIDGSVFIDDDGKWSFYHASGQGIMGCSMSGPKNIGTSLSLNANMNYNWTEGPCVFKRDNKYYMIYTGNHLISKGYRIDYATNTTGPVSPFTPAASQNPILLDALGNHTGLGHGSMFIGPDLDSYYLTYHNLVSGTGPYRRLNFDLAAWNGDKMYLLGPTVFKQHNPELPDAYDYFERTDIGGGWSFPSGGKWSIKEPGILSQDTLITGSKNGYIAVLDSLSMDNFTAEFNFKETFRETDSARLGAVFGYSDNDNYGTALVKSFSNQLEINFITNKTWGTPVLIDMPADFDYSFWHNIRIEKFNNEFKFFVDGMLRHTMTNELEAGKIGYLGSRNHANYGFIGFSNKVQGSGTFDTYKPVPGKLPAVQYISGGEGIGFHKLVLPSQSVKILRYDEADIVPSALGGYALASVKAGEWFKYNMNVEIDRLYNIELYYAAEQADCQVRFMLDGTDISGLVDLPATGGNSVWKSFLVKDLQLLQGFHSLKLEVVSGELNIYSLETVIADNKPVDVTLNFDAIFGNSWKYFDGDWKILDKCAVIDGYGKRTYGSEAWRDYTLEVDIQFTRSMNAGILVRAQNPALGGAGNDAGLGTDFLQSYFVGFNYSSLVLGKHNYGWKSLASFPGSYTLNVWYHLRVTVTGDRIRVFVDDMNTALIDYTDPLPLITGMAGLRSFNTGVKFDNFHVTSNLLLTSAESSNEANPGYALRIYPNPSSDEIKLFFDKSCHHDLLILDARGAAVYKHVAEGTSFTIPVGKLSPGIYFIRVNDGTEVQIEKLIIN
jgi:hypothetical protein